LLWRRTEFGGRFDYSRCCERRKAARGARVTVTAAECSGVAAIGPARCRLGGSERLVHDAPNGACAPAALGAAAQAVIDFTARPWGILAAGEG